MPSWDWTWDDAHVGSFDFETSGTKPEYALQPWRITTCNSWATSLVWLWPLAGKLVHDGGLGLPLDRPDPAAVKEMILRMLRWAVRERRRLCGWNTVFDIAICIAYGTPIELIR